MEQYPVGFNLAELQVKLPSIRKPYAVKLNSIWNRNAVKLHSLGNPYAITFNHNMLHFDPK